MLLEILDLQLIGRHIKFQRLNGNPDNVNWSIGQMSNESVRDITTARIENFYCEKQFWKNPIFFLENIYTLTTVI